MSGAAETPAKAQVDKAGNGDGGDSGRRRRQPLRHYLEAYSFLGLLIVAAVFFATWPETSETFTSLRALSISLISSDASTRAPSTAASVVKSFLATRWATKTFSIVITP